MSKLVRYMTRHACMIITGPVSTYCITNSF